MLKPLKKLALCTLIAGNLLATSSVSASEAIDFEVPEVIESTPDDYVNLAGGMVTSDEWKVFDKGIKGGEEGVEYIYLFSETNRSYLGVMRYLGETNIEDLLLGALYRADKESWTILDHTEIKNVEFAGYRIDYITAKEGEDDIVNVVAMINSNGENHMVMFTLEESKYEKGIYSDIIAKFK